MATPTNLPAAQTTGNVLTAAYMNDLRGAFRILQVLYTFTGTQVTSTTTTFVDVGLSITITPQSASNKILLINSQALYASGGQVDIDVRFIRGATNVYGSRQAVINSSTGMTTSMIHLDEPATTSAVTYKVQFNRAAGAGTAVAQVSGVAASSFIVMEVSA